MHNLERLSIADLMNITGGTALPVTCPIPKPPTCDWPTCMPPCETPWCVAERQKLSKAQTRKQVLQ